MVVGIMEGRVKHLLHFRQIPCLISFHCPHSTQHKVLHLIGAQNTLLNEKVSEKVSGEGEKH